MDSTWQYYYLLLSVSYSTGGGSIRSATFLCESASQLEVFEWFQDQRIALWSVFSALPLTREAFEHVYDAHVDRNRLIVGGGA